METTDYRKSPASVSWELIAPPTYELLTVAEARLHLRLETYGSDDDAAEDAYITELIVAAGELIETHTRRPVRDQRRRLYVRADDSIYGDQRLDGGPWYLYYDDGLIRLNATPIRSVDSVSYLDDGRRVVMDAADYTVVGADGGINRSVDIRPVEGVTWPWELRSRANDSDIRIEVTAGYAQASLPAQLKHAARILVNDFYAQRSELVIGTIVGKVPRSVNALLATFARNVFR